MLNALMLSLVVCTAPLSEEGLEFQKLGEVGAELKSGSPRVVDGGRTLHLMNEFEREKNRITQVIFVLADVVDRKLVRLPFRLADFGQAHADLFTTQPPAVPDLVAYSGGRALLRFNRQDFNGPGKQRADRAWAAPLFCLWDPAVPADCPLKEILTLEQIPPTTRLSALNPDPTGAYQYFAVGTPDAEGTEGQSTVKLLRVSLADPALPSDWEMNFERPARPHQLSLKTHTFSFDGQKLAWVEYLDQEKAEKLKPTPSAHLYVIDFKTKKVATFPAPLVTYGLTFSRNNASLAMGSFETGAVSRIDLKTKKVVHTVTGLAATHLLLALADGTSLLSLGSHVNGPRPIEVRRWGDLKLIQTIPVDALFPGLEGLHPSGCLLSPDGKLLVTPRYATTGFPEGGGLAVFDVKP